MDDQKYHYRHELKYLINEGDRELLSQRLKVFAERDPHAEGGSYKIRSLYFDDFWNSAYTEKIQGVNGRRKYRIRVYDDRDDVIKLECKIKQESYILKKSASLTREEYEKIVAGEYSFLLGRNEPLFDEFYYQLTSRLLRPRVIVDYEREPFIMDAGDVRVTFDSNVRACSGHHSIFDADAPTLHVLEPNKLIMEVKFTEFLPGLIKRILPLRASEHAAVSKYVLSCDQTGYLYAKNSVF